MRFFMPKVTGFIFALIVFAGSFEPSDAEQSSPMIAVLPGCPVTIADVEVVPAPASSYGERQFYITALLGGTSKSPAMYSGAISYVLYDESRPQAIFGSMESVPGFMYINMFRRMNIATYTETYHHHVVGKPVAALFMSCWKVPDALLKKMQLKLQVTH